MAANEPAKTAKEKVLGRKIHSKADFDKAVADHNAEMHKAMGAEIKAQSAIAELHGCLFCISGTVVGNDLDGTKRTLTVEDDKGVRTQLVVDGDVRTDCNGVNVSLATIKVGDKVECCCDGKTGALAYVEATSSMKNAHGPYGRVNSGGPYASGAPHASGPGPYPYSVRQEGAVWHVVDADGNVVKSHHLQAAAVSEMQSLNPTASAAYPNDPNHPHNPQQNPNYSGNPNPNNPNPSNPDPSNPNPSYPGHPNNPNPNNPHPNLSNPPQNETLKEKADRQAAEAAAATNPPQPGNPTRVPDGETVEQRTAREGREAAEDAAARRRGKK